MRPNYKTSIKEYIIDLVDVRKLRLDELHTKGLIPQCDYDIEITAVRVALNMIKEKL